MRFPLLLSVVGAVLLVAACTQSPAPAGPPGGHATAPTPPATAASPAPSPSPSPAATPAPAPTTPVPTPAPASAPSPAPTSSPSPSPAAVKPLSSLEQKLVGTWGRYHRQSESYKQFVFNADRTACFLEISRKSNRREDERPYPRWELDEKNPIESNVYAIVIEGHGRLDQFHYKGKDSDDRIWQGGFENLVMGRATPEKCLK